MIELNRNIVFQYFLGTASPLQKKLIAEWLEDDNNQELFYQWLEEFESEHVQFIPDVTAASKRVMNKLDGTPAEMPVPLQSIGKSRSFSVWKAGRVAAAVLLAAAMFLYFYGDKINHVRYQSAYGQVKEFMLPDGSRVVLNANSSLIVPRWGFGSGDRVVRVTGEAAFFVKHTQTNQRFFVRTGGQLNVEVLGTEFSVYSRDENTKVELNKGSVKVLFTKADARPFLMKPGDVVNMTNTGELLIKHQQQAKNFLAWRDHRFVFDATTLEDAVHSIHEFFGDQIGIADDELKASKISGSFKAESSKELLSALAQMFDLEIATNSDSLILKKRK